MKTISVSRFKMKHAVVSLLWILSIEVIQSSNSSDSTTTINQKGVTTAAATTNATAEEGRKSVSSEVSYSTSNITVTLSPSINMVVSTSSSLSDSFVTSTTNTPGLETTVPRMTSTTDPSPSKTLTHTMTSATASETITSKRIQPTQPVASSKESNMTEKSTTFKKTPQNVASKSKSVTPVASLSATITTHGVTSTPESKSVTPTMSHNATITTHGVTSTPESKRVTPAISHNATITTHGLTSTSESKSVTPTMSQNATITTYSVTSVSVTTSSTTNRTVQNVTRVQRESVTPMVSNEISMTTASVTATRFSITPSFTSTFVTSSLGAAQTQSSNTSATDVASVTVMTSAAAKRSSVTSTLVPASETTSSPPVAKTTGIRSSATITTIVTTPSTVITTSTQPPTTTPSTTTKPEEEPKFIKPHLPKEMSVNKGETLKLTCKATGFPPPVIIWIKGTDNPLKNTSRIVISSDNSTLKILKTTRQDDATYQCNASNGVGIGVTAETKVKVIFFSDLFININQRFIKEGDTVQLTCSVDAYPNPFLEWKKDGVKYDGDSKQYSKDSRYVSDIFLRDIKRELGGNYTCWARNRTGTNLLGAASKMLFVNLSSVNLPTYPPPKRMTTSDHTITIPIHKITYLGNGKKVSYIQVIVNQLKDQTLPKRKPSSFQPSELGPYSKNRTELYIAAVISLEDVDELGSNVLVLGDGKDYPTSTTARRRRSPHDGDEVYHNAPLLPETYYTAFQRMVHVSSGQYHESLGWMPATKTDSGPHEVKSDSTLSTILWIVCVSLFLLIVVIVCMVVYVFKKNKTREMDIDGPELRSEKNGGALGKMARSLSFHMARLHDHYHPSGPIPIENFADHVTRMHKSGDMHFSTEYERIPEYVNIPATHSIDPANQWKNRYSNIVAYDYNRVKLIPYDDEPASDYINASYITGYNNENTYIAAQGPLDETCGDFWRMVWEQNTRVIVMLTNVRERGRLKCSQYWPTSGKQRYEVIYVSLEDVIELTAYTIRVFRIAMSGQKETRVIKQFHFTGWPDHGVPKSATFLLAFVRQTAKANPADAGPMVVHCSAGVGRTGTFIVIDVMLQQIAKEKTVDILNYVTQLRKQRNLMVQTEQQYIFIHDALLDVIIGGDTEIHASKLRKHVQEMTEPYKETGETKMTLEFRKLSRGLRPHTNFTAATIPANKSKNRYANTLPFDDNRVTLVVQTAVNGSDYINANYIDAYMRKRALIATQAPLPDTFDDFWRMMWEQKCYTIVVLAQEVENAKLKMNRYWPTTHPITFGNLQVEMLDEEKKEFLETRVFNITDTTDSSSQIVHQFHYTAWTSEDLSDSGINLLSMIEQIQQWQDASGNHVITVHCSAGVGRTGVFCAVSSLIERIKAEAVVDVFQTVKQLREQRPAMVQTKSQYEFCYRVLLEYLDTHASLEELDPFPVSPESSNSGNPPPSEEDQNEVSGQNSPLTAESNRKSDPVDSASTTESLSEVKEKSSSNHNTPETVTSEHLEPGDVTSDDKAQENVTAENNSLENVTVDVTLENGVTEENATPENVTQQNNSTENIENGTLEGDVTLKDAAHEDVTQQKVSQDVMPETNQKTDKETLANNDLENSRAVLQRADSEESDPYVSPLSSSLNINGS